MDAVLLSRIQFGLTAFFHFFFPPLTIGLAALLAFIEYKHWRTGKKVYDEMSRFWTKLFVACFAVGVASGITMEFQFGTNWSEYSKFVGDIFGAPLAAEGVFAFFLESTFIALLIFGRERISAGLRFFAALMVALGSSLSAFWIIVANSWQQTPAGFKVEGGRAILTDFAAAVFNPSTIPRYLHTLDGAYITGAFFMMAISAYLLLKKKRVELARHSLKLALVVALVASLLQVFLGDIHAKQVAETQPAKLAAFEGLWETKKQAPLLLIGIPAPAQERNLLEIGVPGALSWLAFGDPQAEVKGLKDFPREERPPVAASFYSFRLMVVLGSFFAVLLLWALWLLYRGKLYEHTFTLKALLWSLPLPFLANELGWMAAEIGRQPWIVYGLLKTQAAASPLPAGQILLTILAFVLIYSFLFGMLVYLIRRIINKAMAEDVQEVK
ncbi:cytochrome ubiquinol oxidase subunit I [Carboxydocella sp. JDF658]|uniref:cytochrome ubiquinol oxidase subunit I n=1 Tax=Carboxydocella sp. JDF658 TaxID=1926600 RepID=UPI0009AE59FA|nr:cytochrome ubiquinol oxidase subunit I [Carboxydocella sp. JDF658]GAW31344.1 cytochrome ubiquinol oxidase subunit I [Carboxydocella sp. JDF658]